MVLKFQIVFGLYLYRLVVYVYNFYEDINSLVNSSDDQSIKNKNNVSFVLILISLISPSILNAIYLVIKAILHEKDSGFRNIAQKIIEGCLLMLFQLKKYLDNILYSVRRICTCRSPKPAEKRCLDEFERGTEFKEFFEDLYGTIPVICLELYSDFNTILVSDVNQMSMKTNWKLFGLVSSILSMMVAIRRRDDGPVTHLLSFIGWFSIFVSRILIFAIGWVLMGPYLLIPITLHVVCISIWVHSIAINSFRSQSNNMFGIVSKIRRFLTSVTVFLFFGIPSLILWPILFQLREKSRTVKFLMVIILENLVSLGVFFLSMYFKTESNAVELGSRLWPWLLLVIFVTTTVGPLFIYLYVCVKPKMTDQVIRHDAVRGIDSKTYGIYFEFFEIIFKLPEVDEIAEDLKELRESSIYRNVYPSLNS